MIGVLKVMILEDQKTDKELIKRQVKKYEPKSVFTMAKDRATFLEKIEWYLPNLILADYNLIDYTGLDALLYVKENKPFIPFIFITGALRDSDQLAKVVTRLADGFILKRNMNTVASIVSEVMHTLNDKMQSGAEEYDREIQKKVSILRAIEDLNQSKDFVGKDDLMKILNEQGSNF